MLLYNHITRIFYDMKESLFLIFKLIFKLLQIVKQSKHFVKSNEMMYARKFIIIRYIRKFAAILWNFHLLHKASSFSLLCVCAWYLLANNFIATNTLSYSVMFAYDTAHQRLVVNALSKHFISNYYNCISTNVISNCSREINKYLITMHFVDQNLHVQRYSCLRKDYRNLESTNTSVHTHICV